MPDLDQALIRETRVALVPTRDAKMAFYAWRVDSLGRDVLAELTAQDIGHMIGARVDSSGDIQLGVFTTYVAPWIADVLANREAPHDEEVVRIVTPSPTALAN